MAAVLIEWMHGERLVPFFFKPRGGANKKKADRLLEGRTWSEMPRGVAAALAG